MNLERLFNFSFKGIFSLSLSLSLVLLREEKKCKELNNVLLINNCRFYGNLWCEKENFCFRVYSLLLSLLASAQFSLASLLSCICKIKLSFNQEICGGGKYNIFLAYAKWCLRKSLISCLLILLQREKNFLEWKAYSKSIFMVRKEDENGIMINFCHISQVSSIYICKK